MRTESWGETPVGEGGVRGAPVKGPTNDARPAVATADGHQAPSAIPPRDTNHRVGPGPKTSVAYERVNAIAKTAAKIEIASRRKTATAVSGSNLPPVVLGSTPRSFVHDGTDRDRLQSARTQGSAVLNELPNARSDTMRRRLAGFADRRSCSSIAASTGTRVRQGNGTGIADGRRKRSI